MNKDYLQAILISFLISLILTPLVIRILRRYKVGQNIRPDGPAIHIKKRGTPTMGGISIILTLVICLGFSIGKSTPFLSVVLFSFLGYAILGFIDDYYNINKRGLGLKARYKLLGQIILALIIVILIFKLKPHTILEIPFINKYWDLGIFYIPFAILVLVGTVNAVNLTDGIDGLAAGCIIIVLIGLSYFTNMETPSDLMMLQGIIIGATLGFLWFNIYPAKVFMGNTGSLALGGLLGAVALCIKKELYLVAMGSVFVLEALSVIIQVIYFKTTRKRIFRMSPLHHHFELSGWSETQITIRFWIFALILTLICWQLS